MRAIVHIRVSTDKQAASGLGLEAQIDACLVHAARLGVEAVGPFIDAGVSGDASLDKRTGLLDAINELEKGDILLVAKLDRLSRADPFEVATIRRMVERKKARVVSAAGEGTDDDSPQGRLVTSIMEAFNTFEKAVIASRTRAAMRRKKANSELCSRLPYGQRIASESVRLMPDGTEKIIRHLEAVPAEDVLLDQVFALKEQGTSYGRIATYLETYGYPTRSGRPWSRSTVYDLVQRLTREREETKAKQISVGSGKGLYPGFGEKRQRAGDPGGPGPIPNHTLP